MDKKITTLESKYDDELISETIELETVKEVIERLYSHKKSRIINSLIDRNYPNNSKQGKVGGVLTYDEDSYQEYYKNSEPREEVYQGDMPKPILKRFIHDLHARKEEDLKPQMVNLEDTLEKFMYIENRLKEYRHGDPSIFSRDDGLVFIEYLEALKPSWNFKLNLAKRLIAKDDLWFGGGIEIKSVNCALRELVREVPNTERDKYVKEPLMEKVKKSLNAFSPEKTAIYLHALFSATLYIRKENENELDALLFPAVGLLSKDWNKELALSVSLFLAGAPKPRLTKTRESFEKIKKVWDLRSQYWVVREALR